MSNRVKCPNCGDRAKKIDPKKPYKYTASGLDNVGLVGVEVYECDCGKGMVWLPEAGRLHRAIAISLLKKPAALEGKELRFLRKHFRLKATELAGILNVSKQTMSLWENGVESIGKANDKLARIYFMLLLIDELNKSKEFAKARKQIFNEKSIDELLNLFDISMGKKKKIKITIPKEKLRKKLDPFELATV